MNRLLFFCLAASQLRDSLLIFCLAALAAADFGVGAHRMLSLARKILTAKWLLTRPLEVRGLSDRLDFECKRDYVSELTIPFILKVPANLRFARTSSSRDPHRIQTCNLLIRSQMLYSVELAGLVVFLLFVLYQSELLLFDSCLLA